MKFFWKLFYIYLVTCFINVNAAEVPNCSTAEKNHIHSNYIMATFDQIYITDVGMFVRIEGEEIQVMAIHCEDINDYRCDIHDRLHDLVTCPHCSTVYDRYQHRICPNRSCPSRLPGPKT